MSSISRTGETGGAANPQGQQENAVEGSTGRAKGGPTSTGVVGALVGFTREDGAGRRAIQAANTAIRAPKQTLMELSGSLLLAAAHPGGGRRRGLESAVSSPTFDPMLDELVRVPGGLAYVKADIHTHDRGYDFRKNFTFRQIQNRSKPTSLMMHGSIPQFCGDAHYSSVNAPELTMRFAGKMDRRVADDYTGLYRGYLKAKKKGDAEKATDFAMRLARSDMSLTGVDPSKPGSVAYMRKTLLENPGVFVGVGEWTGDKEFVSTLLGNEAFKFGDPETLKALGFAEQTGMVTLIHNDWGRHGLNEHDLRPEARQVAYEHFDRLIDVVAKFPNANIILAHTGIGRFARPDDAMTKVEVPVMTRAGEQNANGRPSLGKAFEKAKSVGTRLGLSGRNAAAQTTETIEVPEHIARLYEAVKRAPNVKFDVSWNDVGEAYMSDPQMRKGLVDFIVRYPDKVLFGSDSVKPVNEGQYNQALTLLSPLIADVARRDPEAAFKLLRGNYEAVTSDAHERSNAWTDAELTKQFDASTSKRQRKKLIAQLEQIEVMESLRKPVREKLGQEARARFDQWHALLMKGHEASAGVGQATGRSAYQEAHDNLPTPEPQTWEGDPYGAGTARGRQGSMSKAKKTAVAAAGVTVAAGAVAAGVDMHSVPLAATLAMSEAAFAARGVLNAGRAIYTEGLRGKSDRMFEWGEFSDKDLNVFMERLRELGPQFGIEPERIDAAERLTDQFRANHARLTRMPASAFETIPSDPAVGVTNEDREQQKFNVVMSEVGRYQINLDRALGVQATSLNATDPRTRTGRLVRGITAGTLFVNVTDTAALLASGHGGNPAAVAFSVLFGLANTALLGQNLLAYAGGRENMNLETDARSPSRMSQPAAAALLAAASGPWMGNDVAQTVHALMHFQGGTLSEVGEAAGGAFQAATEATVGVTSAQQAASGVKRLRGGQMPSGSGQARPIVRGNLALALREGSSLGRFIATLVRRDG
ncbi:amidohydrolase family protein [Trinickia acidisoli]|uniref:amidohydrolase family protein n=1 Tax=Trinickia acidisoli TaxID=2767482 RepID=UPI001A8F34BB|nr:amidohydrolase family protein [Trinickia acidisoli]